MSKTTELRFLLERKKGQHQQLLSDASKLKATIKDAKRQLLRHEQAREIIREAGLKTQQGLQYHIGEITTLALDSVFDNPYSLEVEFVQRRNKTECDLFFVRDGERIDPLSASGGGAVDVASFALRIASWSMRSPRTQNVIILDEPLKNLSADLQERGSAMLREVSKKLGIQFIIITHEETLTAFADRIFKVEMKKGVSKVTQRDNTPEEY